MSGPNGFIGAQGRRLSGGWIDRGGALAEADYGAVRLHNVNMDAGKNRNVGKESQVSTTARLLITWHH